MQEAVSLIKFVEDMQTLWKYTKKGKRRQIPALILMIIGSIIFATIPMIAKNYIDNLTKGNDGYDFTISDITFAVFALIGMIAAKKPKAEKKTRRSRKSAKAEAPAAEEVKAVEAAPAETKLPDSKRLEDEYGVKAITDMTLRQLSARYLVLTPEEMDDDDVIDMIEKTPTYGRKQDFRNQIKERQQASSQDRPVEVPKATKRGNNSDSQTINFGDDSFN